MIIVRRICMTLCLMYLIVPVYGRGWASCTESVGCCPYSAKPPVSKGKRSDVIPLGYPYGNDRSSRPYLAPYAHPSPYEFGQPFTFGYVAVESTGVRQPRGTKVCTTPSE